MLSCANGILKVASHEADKDDCCWVESREGLEGPRTCCVHGVVCKCTSVMESGSPLVGRWRCQSHYALALNLHLKSLYNCLDVPINMVDLEGRLFTHSLLLRDRLICPVLKSFKKAVVFNWIQALEGLQRKKTVSHSCCDYFTFCCWLSWMQVCSSADAETLSRRVCATDQVLSA